MSNLVKGIVRGVFPLVAGTVLTAIGMAFILPVNVFIKSDDVRNSLDELQKKESENENS